MYSTQKFNALLTFYELVVYSVPIGFGNDFKISSILRTQYPEILSARRILKFPNKEPTTTVRVRISNFDKRNEILLNGCRIGYYLYRTGLSKKRELARRCYKCQRIGIEHLAWNCPNEIRCLKCSDNHHIDQCKSMSSKCANCHGNHAADSTLCQHWIREVEHQRSMQLQQQHRRVRAGDIKTNNNNVIKRLDELKSLITDHVKSSTEQIQMLKSEIRDVRSTIALHLLPPRCAVPPDLDPLTPDMTWDEFDLSNNNQADDLSADDDHHLRAKLKQSDQLATSDNPGSSQAALCASTPDVNMFSTLYPVNSVTNDDELEKRNPTKLVSDSQLDAMKLEKHDEPNASLVDPEYVNFFERMDKLTEQEIAEYENKFNAYDGEVLFRYSDGKIGQIMDVILFNGGVSFIEPCDMPIKSVKNLKTDFVKCCPFHHLASEIRDTIDRGDIVGSLARWRTKNLSPFCAAWKTDVDRYMEGLYGHQVSP